MIRLLTALVALLLLTSAAQADTWTRKTNQLLNRTIDRTLQNSVTAIDDVTREVRDGNTYHVSHLFEGVADAEAVEVLIQVGVNQVHLRKKVFDAFEVGQ